MIEKIIGCKSIEELDGLRLEIANYAKQHPYSFKHMQKEFIKKKEELIKKEAKLKEIPLLREKIVWKQKQK